jgi:hypothetical protein
MVRCGWSVETLCLKMRCWLPLSYEPIRSNLNAMTQKTLLALIVAAILAIGACQSPQSKIAMEPSTSRRQSVNCVPMLNPSATVAKYPPNANPGFNSPEEVTAFLEKRWSPEAIRKFTIPERRHNDQYQNLVTVGFPEVWSGRLYCDKTTGFDSIEWYATIEIQHTKHSLHEYSLGVIRGEDLWLLEIGSPTSVQQPPNIEPDFRKPYFVGHK